MVEGVNAHAHNLAKAANSITLDMRTYNMYNMHSSNTHSAMVSDTVVIGEQTRHSQLSGTTAAGHGMHMLSHESLNLKDGESGDL